MFHLVSNNMTLKYFAEAQINRIKGHIFRNLMEDVIIYLRPVKWFIEKEENEDVVGSRKHRYQYGEYCQ